MKKLLVLGIVCLLTACGTADPNPSPSTTKHDRPTPMSDWNNGFNQDKGPGLCDSFSVYSVVVGGHTYLVSVKSPCDATRYVFKGDPGPDMGQPWDSRDTVSKEDILSVVERLESEHSIAP
jgi:hypothetical protein